LSIILYSDATTTDSLGKNSLHPIYISLGNIPTWRRNKEDAKQFLGYLPIVSAKSEAEKRSSDFKLKVREVFHQSLKFLLKPLFENKRLGVEFKINDEKFWFYPRISTIICDWPEACTFSLTYKSANSNYPCHFCTIHKNNMIDKNAQIVVRNHEDMIKYFEDGTAASISLEQVYNYFWDIP
jgi:Plavaka transposase